jgi:Ni,Fe-hydrogenase I large subunit
VSIEGELKILLQCQADRVHQVEIKSTRPLQLTRLFKGKPVAELLTMIPMLYSVCGTAQSAAAVQACRQATGLCCDSQTVLLEKMLVDVETAREHLWRILSDWSQSSERSLDGDTAASLATLMVDAKQACFPNGDSFTLTPQRSFDPEAIQSVIGRIARLSANLIYGLHPSEWYGLNDCQGFYHWLDHNETDASRLLQEMGEGPLAKVGDGDILPLPAIDHLEICQRLAQDDAAAFIATPEWGGRIYETGPLTRQKDHPLLRQIIQKFGWGVMTRLVARLLELAAIPNRLDERLNTLMRSHDGIEKQRVASMSEQGIGEIEAARGRLFHRAVQQNGIISSYQIVAPTEWNFHPRGVVARGLKHLSVESKSVLKQQAELLINAVDPCVGFHLEII